ncbi:MAG: hypothetical protein HYY87_02935 [Candidatus Levybacteria bacterium]|nr:hypothetical protein [Candidatus Levybacteria bacterium]MBI2190138.1 hypothetical protein [Candidatus Levybacteria bacterium]MBI2622874.1 hypothetical protein [Candidatus Levybacteria bacterium]MBI3070234.1 hypothetical protein [Candidatus Levybacteria bacterium]MBI3093116.1 hypothetical protein [Candidatus Levybacteria bacterium]
MGGTHERPGGISPGVLIEQPPEQIERAFSGNGQYPTQDQIPTHVFGKGQRLKRDRRITILDFEGEIENPCAKGFVRLSRGSTTYLKNSSRPIK